MLARTGAGRYDGKGYMSVPTAQLEKTTYERKRGSEDSVPSEDERAQIAYRVRPGTKRDIDLIATALNEDKTKVVEDAVELYKHFRSGDITQYVEQVRATLRGKGAASAGELLTGKRIAKGYRGGPPSR